MDPANESPAIVNLRNTALVFLGVLALISLIVAVVAANTPIRMAMRDTGDKKPATTGSSSAPASPAAPSATAPASGQAGGADTDTDQPVQVIRPAVVYFRLKQQPRCAYGKPQPAVVEWKVAGAPGATLAVDGPGLYGRYPGATGTQTLNFSCGGAKGSTEKHTYTLTTSGDGEPCSQQIVATATVEGPAVQPSVKPSQPAHSAPPAEQQADAEKY